MNLLGATAWYVLLAGASSIAHAAAVDTSLTVAAIGGTVAIERLGQHHALQLGETVEERDVVRLGDDGHVALQLVQSGVLELGPNAEMSVEKLPSAAKRRDRKSIFNLAQGALRITWTPSTETAAPLYLYFNGQRAQFTTGDYQLEATAADARVCVAGGELTATPIAGSTSHVLKSTACYQLKNGGEPEKILHDAAVWTSMRNHFNLDIPAAPDLASAPITVPAATQPGPTPPPAHDASRPPTASPATVAGPLTTKSAAGGGWAINIASYADRAAADKQTADLQAAGYHAGVQTTQINGHEWYRVQVRGFASSDAAHAQMQALKSKPGYASAWVVRVP